MVLTLPGFGRWASAIREFEMPYGKSGIRQLEVFYILRHCLFDGPETSATALAKHLQIQRSVVTRILVKLESGGYIERTVDPRDGRAQQISITEKGRLLSDYVEQAFFDEMVSALGEIEIEDLEHMGRAMQVLTAVLVNLGFGGAAKRLAEQRPAVS